MKLNVYTRENSDYVNAGVSIFELWHDGNPVNRSWQIIAVKDEPKMIARLRRYKEGFSLYRCDRLDVAIDFCEGEALRMGGRIEGRIEQYLAENQEFWRPISDWPRQVKPGSIRKAGQWIRKGAWGHCRECGRLTKGRYPGPDGREGFYCSSTCAMALGPQAIRMLPVKEKGQTMLLRV